MLLIMNRILHLTVLLFLSFFISNAQTTWTGFGANDNWNNIDNWSTFLVPTASDNVIIPTGFTVNINVAANVLSLQVQGNSTLNIGTNLTFTEASSFSAGTTINWNSGYITGTSTSLTNNGTVNVFVSSVFLGGLTTFINNGQVNFTSTGDIYIAVDAELNNTTTGTISFLANGGNFSESGNGNNLLTNDGLIVVDLPDANHQVFIYTEFQNNDGTIQVNNGILNLSHNILEAQVLTDGTYNVASTGTLDFDSAITLTGSLSGTLDGTLNWRGYTNVALDDTASFDFTGSAIVDWVSGALVGGGTLTNNSTINIVVNSVFIYDASALINNSDIRFTNTGDIYIGVDGVVNNTSTGTISFLANGGNFSESGNGNNLLTNDGLIVVDLPGANDQVYIYTEFQNNDGTIQVNNGILNFSHSILEAQVLTDGTYNVASTGTLDFDSAITLTGSLSGTLDGTLNWRGYTNVALDDTASFDFTGSAIVDWVSGALVGGGTLTNNSIINIVINNVFINDASALINNSDIRFTNTGDIYIAVDAELNNTTTGTISFLANGGNFLESGNGNNLLTNDGLIIVDLPSANDQVYIYTEFQNNDGTIQVNNGILNFSHSILEAQVLTDGTYNVASTGTLDFDSAITLTGSLSGTLDGTLNWRGYTNVASGDTASFDFTGNATIDWTSGALVGGGTLINNSTIDVLVGNVFIQEISLLTNNSLIQFTGTGNIYIGEDSELRNSTIGLVDFQANGSGISPSGNGINLLNNQGLVKNTSGGNVTISAETENSGTIEATSGVMSISTSLNNQIGGRLSGVGTINLPSIANLTNDGNVSPGLSPGTLTLSGNYLSSSNSVLEMELNGFTPDTQHDVLAISGTNVIFEGMVDVTLGFQPSIGDTFTIATVSGTIATGNLVSPIYAEYDCLQYTFDVSYPNNDSVLLTVSDEADVHNPVVITQDITLTLDATGNASITTNDIDNGSTDNCGIDTMSLDMATFTCNNLGANTVTLTVTDVNGNVANNTAIVTVVDNILPLVVTQDLTVQLDALGNASITAAQVDNGSSDNCSIASLDLDVTDFTCANLGANTVTLTITDQSGNSASASATVTVEDSMSPSVATQDLTVQLDALGNASITAAQVDNGSSDNCSIASLDLDVTDFTCANLGANTVTLTITDQSGNSASASATVTVEDNIAPTINCPSGITVESNGDFTLPDYYLDGLVTVDDNCGISSVVQTPSAGSILPDGYYDIDFIVTDIFGNSKSCMFQIKVEDLTLNVNAFELTESHIVLYPNPATNMVTLKNNSHVNLKSATIIDVKGSVIQKINLEAMGLKQTISLQDYASGVYFVKIYSETSSIVKRLIKQ